jgi:hypothetical protein
MTGAEEDGVWERLGMNTGEENRRRHEGMKERKK